MIVTVVRKLKCAVHFLKRHTSKLTTRLCLSQLPLSLIISLIGLCFGPVEL